MAKPKLTRKQEAFIANYTNPAKPTFLNGKQSYQDSHKGVTDRSASALASTSLANVKIKNVVERILSDMGYCLEDRMQDLVKIAAGKDVRTTITKRRDQDGKLVVDMEVETTPTYTERIKAIQIMNKLDGSEDRAKAQGVEAKELAKLRAKILGELIEGEKKQQKKQRKVNNYDPSTET